MLAPLFVFVLGLGIAGSALATILCEFVSFVLLLWQIQRVGITPLSMRYVSPGLDLAREVNNGGVPSFVRQCMFVSLSQPTSLDYWRSTPTARRI